MSYMPLPPDVESGLRRSQPSFVPARQMTGSRGVSRYTGGSRLRPLHVLSGKVAVHQSMKDVADSADDAAANADADAAAGGLTGLVVAGDADVLGQQQLVQQDRQASSVRQRARNLWNGLFRERHDVRMYKGMVVKQHKVRLMRCCSEFPLVYHLLVCVVVCCWRT
jgi:hypothetical protein